MLINMDVLTFEVKQFRYTNSAVYQHKYDLDVEIVPLHPECLDFLITERTAVGSVRISVFVFESEYRTVKMPIIPTESEVLHMKKTHGLDDREMELVKLLMADCQTNLLV